jgi:hypothetical protein
MTVHCADNIVSLEGVCPIEEAEILMQQLQAGAIVIDLSACTHLHTACLQVILAARVPTRGIPANAALAHWLAPLLPVDSLPPSAESETARRIGT